jgi:hypothetical protein
MRIETEKTKKEISAELASKNKLSHKALGISNSKFTGALKKKKSELTEKI